MAAAIYTLCIEDSEVTRQPWNDLRPNDAKGEHNHLQHQTGRCRDRYAPSSPKAAPLKENEYEGGVRKADCSFTSISATNQTMKSLISAVCGVKWIALRMGENIGSTIIVDMDHRQACKSIAASSGPQRMS